VASAPRSPRSWRAAAAGSCAATSTRMPRAPRLTKTTRMSGCSSWYLTADGFNASMYPGFATQYLQQMRDFRFGHYVAVAQGAHAAIGARAGA